MTQANLILMDGTKDASPLQSYFSDSTQDKLNNEQNIGQDYYKFSNTNMYFPKLIVNEENLPAGNSKPYCLHLDWYLRAKSSLIANYKGVTGMDNCTDYNNPKVLWR